MGSFRSVQSRLGANAWFYPLMVSQKVPDTVDQLFRRPLVAVALAVAQSRNPVYSIPPPWTSFSAGWRLFANASTLLRNTCEGGEDRVEQDGCARSGNNWTLAFQRWQSDRNWSACYRTWGGASYFPHSGKCAEENSMACIKGARYHRWYAYRTAFPRKRISRLFWIHLWQSPCCA